MYRTDFWTLWEKARVGCFKRTASKHVYYLGWNRSPAQVGCMRQVLGPGGLGRPRGIGWRGRWEGGSGWGTHVNPWLFHFSVWQNSLQLKKKKKEKKSICPHVSQKDLAWTPESWLCSLLCIPLLRNIFSNIHRPLVCALPQNKIGNKSFLLSYFGESLTVLCERYLT